MKLISLLREFKKIFSSYDPLVKIYIIKRSIFHNLKVFQKKYPFVEIAPVLKSNAYGHGLVPVAKILDEKRIAFLVVDSLYEARLLRSEGVKSKILIIGYTRKREIAKNKLSNVAFTITSLEELRDLKESLKSSQLFHLKIDTGMHRQGILEENFNEAFKMLRENKKIVLEGVCSHFADADNVDKTFSLKQVAAWNKAVRTIKKEFSQIKYFHLTATGGTYYLSKAKANTARIGMGLFGIDPSKLRKLELRPAMRMSSIISGTKKIKKGDFVGYGLTYKATGDMKLAVVPTGYFEGIDRRLSNIGFFKIRNVFCPIIGRISMNMTVVDITKLKKVKIEESVLLVSSNSKDPNSIANIAKACETIPYEILVHIPGHLRREVV